MVDAEFGHPRLAAVYDALDPDRSDLLPYLDLVAALGARRVLDVGCGTGTFALLLAARGLDVVGVDPAAASLAVARAKPGAERVRWVEGDARALRLDDRDVATMTANVAQAVDDPQDWAATLRALHAALVPGGVLVLETRDPAARAWEEWTREATLRTADVAGAGPVTTWTEVTAVEGPLVSFRSTWRFAADGAVLTSDSTLRFRTRDEVAEDLGRAGFTVVDVRDAPDRPGRELVVVARRDAGPVDAGAVRP
ncbi:class I SAM-dependent methyltransferase [Microlunatus capsulatus]|uniref:SAM-dependent methyltransferase n=1 Tax=Microlunatus capsulatus TaxID=99117 RepID=A0ABS4Z3M3_9ACTN|nr:class I SAM-dependent methyltransferase [Microlunatus capsulatus]MBP2415395.1 SAM-dependent methyltransferase [Microlunatus capsulatus]